VRVAFAVMIVGAVAAGACTDVREFRGVWSGPRVGDLPLLDIGVAPTATATLQITSGITSAAPVQSLASAEADALATLSFSGSPLRVYLAFAPTIDGNGDALAVIALYTPARVEVRIMRGGTVPLYAIFTLSSGDSGT
jgi:hypothetical protein